MYLRGRWRGIPSASAQLSSPLQLLLNFQIPLAGLEISLQSSFRIHLISLSFSWSNHPTYIQTFSTSIKPFKMQFYKFALPLAFLGATIVSAAPVRNQVTDPQYSTQVSLSSAIDQRKTYELTFSHNMYCPQDRRGIPDHAISERLYGIAQVSQQFWFLFRLQLTLTLDFFPSPASSRSTLSDLSTKRCALSTPDLLDFKRDWAGEKPLQELPRRYLAVSLFKCYRIATTRFLKPSPPSPLCSSPTPGFTTKEGELLEENEFLALLIIHHHSTSSPKIPSRSRLPSHLGRTNFRL